MDNNRWTYARAPLRLSFGGGGTDTDAFCLEHDGMVVSAAISRYVYCRARPAQGGGSFLSYPLDEPFPEYLADLARGFPPADIEVRVDTPPRSGLGASGALGVAVAGCLSAMAEDHTDPYSLANLAFGTETMYIAAGRQDHYAAATGGINLMTFGVAGVEIKPLKLAPEILLALESSLILIFVHSRAGSSHRLMEAEMQRVRHYHEITVTSLLKQRQIAQDMAQALSRGNLSAFGALLHEAWEVKKRQSPECTNDVINAVYEIGRKAGALGGKLSGAGAGGYMFLFAPGKEGSVTEALKVVGLHPQNVSFDWGGLRTWR